MEIPNDGAGAMFSTLVDSANGVAIDAKGNVYTAGATTWPEDPAAPEPSQTALSSAVVTKIDPSHTDPLHLNEFGKTNVPSNVAVSSGTQAAAPGMLLWLTGDNLGPSEPMSATPDETGAYPKSLGDVRVTFDGTDAPLLSAASGQIFCAVPFAVAGRNSTLVQVHRGEEVSNPVLIAVKPVSLEAIAVVNPDGTANSEENPAPQGTYLTVYVSGMGLTDPAGVDGQVMSEPGTMVAALSARLDSEDAQILYAGPAPGMIAGVGQVNVILPAGMAAGMHTLNLNSNLTYLSVTVTVR